jgi:hypothetical protein
MRHSYNKKRIFICPILNLQGCKREYSENQAHQQSKYHVGPINKNHTGYLSTIHRESSPPTIK